MAEILVPGGVGGGSGSDEVTAAKAQVLEGFTAITSDSDDEPAGGTLPKAKVLADAGGTIETKGDSGNVSLGVGENKSYPSGYYPNNHGAAQGIGSGSVIDSAGGSIVTRNDSRNVGLGAGDSVSFPAGYYPSAHGAYQAISDYEGAIG